MNLQLDKKKVLVTGSTAGIGFAIASVLAVEGASVIVNGRTQQRVDEAVEKIKGEIPNADISGIAADLSTVEGAKSVVEFAPEVEILVNNMGIFEPKAFEEITDEDWIKFFQANVMSGVRLSRHYLPKMKQQNWGRIVFISSESAVQIPAEMIHYGMTKSAQISISRGLAEMTVGTNITVNSVLPGPTASEGVSTFVGQMAAEQNISINEMEKQFFETARPSSLLKRFIEPKEIADLVAFVCSPLSLATNGAALRVEGGVVRSMV
ncbi:MAG: SDR family NAD(P)-dependent oxidoreductase [Acidobacteriota bacterium]|nr:SDR family NAD(P)-dependent oxidoreductase [Acidobacteriota bacterium]